MVTGMTGVIFPKIAVTENFVDDPIFLEKPAKTLDFS
jgi:hypothetical protein